MHIDTEREQFQSIIYLYLPKINQMIHSITGWALAQRPNYVTNVDRIYPYSEVPYIGNYHLVKIPVLPANQINHVDYWGEGRINAKEGSSGFTDCYNVNHQYQLVSNGPDTDRKIPNRISVVSYTNCDTSSYISDNSVKLVTLMGAPINKSCAIDIARMVNSDDGKVVVFGFDSKAADIKNLNEELFKKGLLYSPGYDLTDTLNGLTLFDRHRAYLNVTELKEELYKNIISGSYENAISINKSLHDLNQGNLVTDVVIKLLKDGNKNTMTYAYKLWNSGVREIITNNFPTTFKLILNEEYVRIVNKKNTFVLKLDSNIDLNHERLAVSDVNDKPSNKWKILPILDNNRLYFKIKNIEYNVFLKLDQTPEGGDKKAKGGVDSTDFNLQWSLEPFKLNDDVLVVFHIINREYKQGLKFDDNLNSNGDRQLIGNNSVYDQPEQFTWIVTPYEQTYEYGTGRTKSRK